MLISSPFAKGKLQLDNRVVFQPMEGCDSTPDGGVGELTAARYMRFAASGAAMVWFEAAAVVREGRANPRQLMPTENNLDGFKRLTDAMRETAAKENRNLFLVLQLTHSGRFSKPEGVPRPVVAYRDNPYWANYAPAAEYTVADDDYLYALPDRYAESARLAEKAGFDAVDIKCCHGYLMDETLSAFSREGDFGGSFENRTRLFLSAVDAVAAASALRITSRLNACDMFPYPYGFGTSAEGEPDLAETEKLVALLAARGMDMINITLGNPYILPDVNRPSSSSPERAAAGMRRFRTVTESLQCDFPSVAFVLSGLSYEGADCVTYAEKLLSEGVGELAGFGRMTFAYPEFYKDFLRDGVLDKKKCCLACGKCTELMRAGTVTGCPVRMRETYMPYYRRFVMKKED